MGTLSRLNRLLQSNLGALLDRGEDPERLIDHTLDELDSGLREGQRDLVTARGEAKRLRAEAEAVQAEVERWDGRAALALRSGDEALAREALQQKLSERRRAETLAASAAAADRAATALQGAIDGLQGRQQELQGRRASLVAEVRAARAQDAAAPAGGGLGRLRALTDRIDALEAEVEVAQVLDDPKRRALDARFEALEAAAAGGVVDDELAALKRRVERGE